jgi:hypothetical protein
MKVPEIYRITEKNAERFSRIPNMKGIARFISDESYGTCGGFVIPRNGFPKGAFFFCIASDGDGQIDWEHVSVSIPSEKRTPTWEEMCYIKSLFWNDDEPVMQLHPAKSEYINNHDYCLHLWRPIVQQIPLPDSILVGYKSKNKINATNNL